MVCIVILNWNGWKDTIDCLESLSKMTYDEYFVMIGDNGSANESKEKILEYCIKKNPDSVWIDNIDGYRKEVHKGEILLFDLKENHGFAKGNNLLISYASSIFNPNYYLLLNNDTEVKPNFLSTLVDFQQRNSEYRVLTPLIYYFYDKSLVWNGGGNLFWGVRKYHYADQPAVCVKESVFIPCTFITGCALFFTHDVLRPNGTLFTEAFFHGEEDFEFGLRMKKKHIKMGCVVQSVIYHKVGRTVGNAGNVVGLGYCYYLNRFINLRHNLSTLSFYTFLIVYAPYVIGLFMKKGVSLAKAIVIYKSLLIECHHLDGVSKAKFFGCVNRKY